MVVVFTMGYLAGSVELFYNMSNWFSRIDMSREARVVRMGVDTLEDRDVVGGTETALLSELKRHFTTVNHVKPKASRQESVELYMLARGFKGRS